MIYSMAALTLAPAAAMAVQVDNEVASTIDVANGKTVSKNLVKDLEACKYKATVTLNGKKHNAVVTILNGETVVATATVTSNAENAEDKTAELEFALTAKTNLVLKVENKNANEAVQVKSVALAVNWDHANYVVEVNKVFTNVKTIVEGYQFYIDAFANPAKDRNGKDVANDVKTAANAAKSIIDNAASALGYIQSANDEATKIELYNTYKVYNENEEGNLKFDLNALNASAKAQEKAYQYSVYNAAVATLEAGINDLDKLIEKAKAGSQNGFKTAASAIRTRIEAYRTAVDNFNADAEAVKFADPADLATLEQDFADLQTQVTADTVELALKTSIDNYLPTVNATYQSAVDALNAALIDQTDQKPGLVNALQTLKGNLDTYKDTYVQKYNAGTLYTYENDQLATLKGIEATFTNFIETTLANAKADYIDAKTAADKKVTDLVASYNAKVTDLQTYMTGVFTGTMLQKALDDLRVYQTTKIPKLQTTINGYYSENKVADAQLKNKTGEINNAAQNLENEMANIVSDAESAYDTRKDKYDTNTGYVTAQQTELDGYNNNLNPEPKQNLSSQYNSIKGKIQALQAVIDGLGDGIDTYDVTQESAYTTIVNEVDAFAGKVTNANAETAKYNELKALITGNGNNSLKSQLAAAEAALKTKKADNESVYNKYNSTDGKFVASARFAWKNTELSESINALASNLDELYGDGTTTAVLDALADKVVNNQTVLGLNTQISNLETAIADDYQTAAEAAVIKYNTVVSETATDLTTVETVRAAIKDLDVYTAAPYNYKDQLDQIMSTAEAAQGEVTAALAKENKPCIDALLAIVYASKQTELNQMEQKANNDQDTYLHDNAASLYSTLELVVNSRLTELQDLLDKYEAAYITNTQQNPQPDLGLKRTEYDNEFNGYKQAKNGYDTDYQNNLIADLAAEATDDIKDAVNTFTNLQTNIKTVKDNLAKLSDKAKAQKEHVQAEKAKKIEVDDLIQTNLTNVLAAKKAVVDGYETEAKNAIAGVYTNVSNAISTLSDNVATSRTNETLQADWNITTAPKLKLAYNTIKDTDIPAYESKASNLNNNKKDFDALVNYYTNYKKQQNNSYKTLAEILQEQYGQITAASVGDGALTHYQTVLQTIVDKQGDAIKGYIKQIADKHETQLSNMTYDANFKEQMLTAMGKLEQEAIDSVAAAKLNLAKYQAQTESKVVLQNLWNAVKEKVDGDQTNKKESRLALMNDYLQDISNVGLLIETFYPKGWSASTLANEQIVMKMSGLTDQINAIAANYEDTAYDADLEQSYIDNRQAVTNKLAEADQALSNAVAAITPYASRTNADLLDAIKANAEYQAVSALINSYAVDKKKVNDDADAHRNTAENSKVKYDNTADIAAAALLATNLNDAVSAFKGAVDAVIAGVWNTQKAPYAIAINEAWDKVVNYAAIKLKVDAETQQTEGKTKKETFDEALSIISAIDGITDAIKDPRKVDAQLNKLPEITPALAKITTQLTVNDLATVIANHTAAKVQAEKDKIRQLKFTSAKGNEYKITEFLDANGDMYAVIALESAFDTNVATKATAGNQKYNDGVQQKNLVDKRADILSDFGQYDTALNEFFNDANGAVKTKLAELKTKVDGEDQLADAVQKFNTDFASAKNLVNGSIVAGQFDAKFVALEAMPKTSMNEVNAKNTYFVDKIYYSVGIAVASAVQAQYAAIDADFNAYLATIDASQAEAAVKDYQTPFLAAKADIETNLVVLNNNTADYTNYAKFKAAFEAILKVDTYIAELRGTLAEKAGNAAYNAAITDIDDAFQTAMDKTEISNDPQQFLDEDFTSLTQKLNVQKQALEDVEATINEYKTSKSILSYKDIILGEIQSINNAIDGILNDQNTGVAALKAKYQAHVALVAMNERVKAALDEEINAVQIALDNSKKFISGYGLASGYYSAQVNTYQGYVDELVFAVDQMYKALDLSDIENFETNITLKDNSNKKDYDYEGVDENGDPVQLTAHYYGTWFILGKIATNLDGATWNKVNATKDHLDDLLNDAQDELDAMQMTNQMRAYYQQKLYKIDGEIDDLEVDCYLAADIMDMIGEDYQLIGAAEIASKIATALDGIAEDVQGNIAKDDDTPGIVDVADYRAMVNYVLQNEGYVIPADKSSQEFMVLDVNGDMQVNSADIVAITNIILYGNPAGLGGAGARSDNATALVNLTQESVTAEIVASSGNTKRIAVSLNNFREYSTYQMDITMPQGMTLVNMTLGERAANHELMTNDLNGTTRVVVSTIGGNIFAGNQGDVLYLDVEIDETYRNNGITFDNVIFGTKDAIAREFVVGGNGTTGIGKIEAAGQYVKDSIYNLGGRVVNGIKKGINIITNNDGKTRKVVKK